MADFRGLAAVGKSIERLLNACFGEEEPIEGRRTRAVLVRTEDFPEHGASPNTIPNHALSIFPYRVDFNKTMRAAWSAVGHLDGCGHLPLDIHFLITPWSDSAERELLILGRAMECLEATPILSGPLLHLDGDWAPSEAIQLVLEEISTEAVMRTFDSLPGHYQLSVPYIARVLRLDGRRATPDVDVTTAVTGLKPSAS